MTEEFKPEKVYEDVYIATLTKDKVILQDRSYAIIAEISVEAIAPFLMEGVCVCQRAENWFGSAGPERVMTSESYWFCLDRNTNKRAIAEVWATNGKNQVVMRQPGSSCEV